MEGDCKSVDALEEQIKGYQSDPVVGRQLIVSPAMKRRHLFCLLIRLGSCGPAEPLHVCTRLHEGKRDSGCNSIHKIGALWLYCTTVLAE